MKLVGAGASDGVHDASRLTPVFGIEITGQQAELPNRVRIRDRVAALPKHGIVEDTVEIERIRILTHSVHLKQCSGVVATYRTRGIVRNAGQDLDLTADQRTAIEPILKDQRDQQAVIAQNAALSASDIRKNIQKVNQSTAAKIHALLTDGQRVKFREMQHKQQEKNGGQQTPQSSAPPNC